MPDTAVSSFNFDGEIEMELFSGSSDPIHVSVNGERIEKVIARMFGFPSDDELQAAIDAGVSPDTDVPDVVRSIGRANISVYMNES